MCIYTILSLLIIFILISSVNAADINADATDLTSLSGNDEIVCVQNEFDVLGIDTSTFSELSGEIGPGGNITLQHDYYNYDSGSTIDITIASSVIDGNGAIIDMAESDIQAFKVDASNVTIKNLTIKNAKYSGNNGIIYIGTLSTIENCNFINNSVTDSNGYGGVIYFSYSSYGTVTNCNFVNNSVTCDNGHGGAIYFDNNGDVSDCNFTNNSATYGGAVMFGVGGDVSGCNFINNSAEYGGGLYFKSNGNVSGCNFVNNRRISSEGGAIWMKFGNVTNSNFTNNSASDGGAIYFNRNGDVSGCNFANNFGSRYGGAIRLGAGSKVSDCNFINNSAEYGGAIYFYSDGDVSDCNFINNSATYGGAIYANSLTLANSNFTDNSVKNDGGAVYISSDGDVVNCNFMGNNATTGSAFYFYFGFGTKNIFNSYFLNNRAKMDANTPFNVTKNENNIEITFMGQNNLINAIYSRNNGKVGFTNVTYWGANGIVNTNSFTPVISNNEAGQNITVSGVVNDNIINTTEVTNENGMVVLEDVAGDYLIVVRHGNDTYYTEAEAIFTNIELYANVTSAISTNRTVNITAKSNILNEFMHGNLVFILPDGDEVNATYGGNGTWWTLYTFDNAGDYNINALYEGLGDVTTNNATISIRNEVPISVDDVSIFVGDVAYVVVGVPETINGQNITITVNKTSKNATIRNGEAKANFTGLSAGEYLITVDYLGDGYNIANSTNAILTVSKVDVNVNITADPITIGDDAVVVISGLANATGNITLTVLGNDYQFPITGSEMALGIPYLYENTTVVVSYPGDEKYNGFSESVDIIVNRVDSNISVIVSDGYEGDSYYVNVKLPGGASGNVTIILNGKEQTIDIDDAEIFPIIGALIMRVAYDNLTMGDYNVTAIYYGDDYYCPSDDSACFTISPKENVAMNVTALPVVEGENATINIELPDDAIGATVTAVVDGKNFTVQVMDSDVAITLPALPAGNYTIPVIYSGNYKYHSLAGEANITVNPQPVPPKEDLNVTLYADPITIGDDAVVVISGLANATGNITLTVLGNDYQFPITGSEMALGIPYLYENTTVVVSYPGDEKYNGFSESVDIIVNRVDSNISVIVSDGYEGDSYYVNVKLPGGASGNVTIILNGKEQTIDIDDAEIFPIIGALIMRVAYDNLTMGDYNVTAIYYGDDYYCPSDDSACFTISPKENVAMNVTALPVVEGENATINIELPDDAIGATVTAVVDGKNFTVQVMDSDVAITLPALPAGNYTIPVIYSGNYKYLSLTEETIVAVEKDKSDIISAPDVTKYFGGPERFVVTVTDYEGNPLANKNVCININGISYTRTTNARGMASIALGLNSGLYNVTVTVDNRTLNSVVSILTTVNGSDITKVFRNGTQYYATFLDSEGNYLKNGETVRFNINGVMYDRLVSGDKGLARLNINLQAGEYIITAMNLATGEKTANNITVIPRITENRDIIKYYRNATQYTVKVLGDDGKAVGAGENVTFNINGVLYTRQTDANGIAKLNINLQPGDYIITAEHKGSMVSNNIKVLPVLNAADISMNYRDGTQFKATLVDGQGKPYAYQAVTFNINGVFYNRPTDSTGTAELNINLMPGEYIITSSYNGSSIGNKITIKG